METKILVHLNLSCNLEFSEGEGGEGRVAEREAVHDESWVDYSILKPLLILPISPKLAKLHLFFLFTFT